MTPREAARIRELEDALRAIARNAPMDGIEQATWGDKEWGDHWKRETYRARQIARKALSVPEPPPR